MISFRNLLYAIDLNEDKPVSLVYALEVARTFQSPIHIFYVNDDQAGYRHPTEREDAIALKVMDMIPASVTENMSITYAFGKGDVTEEIVKYAQEHEIDLIMVGHQHHSKLYSSLFDSTSVNVVDSSLLPVLVIPYKRIK